MTDTLIELFLRFAPLKWIPPRLVLPSLPRLPALPGRRGRLHLEIVSHCWRYSHLLVHQLQSLVNHSSSRLGVTFTLFYAPDEDEDTVALLDHFRPLAPPGLTWNFQPLERPRLLRRALGRNIAAKATAADWIWFTDCDVIIHEGALDALAEELQGCSERLVYPREERCTPLLPFTDPLLAPAAIQLDSTGQAGPEFDPDRFPVREVADRAKGAYQIAHGDVARRLGYCDALTVFQKPTDRWRKTYEDRAFRWLAGTQGTAVDVPGLYRIRHVAKGRYEDRAPWAARVRGGIRKVRGR